MTGEHLPALHASSGVAHLMAFIEATPLSWNGKVRG
jgi:hypothetical protein